MPFLAPTFTVDDLTPVMLVGALVVLAAVAAVRVADRSGMPTLLFFLALGIALGKDGLGVRFDDAQLSHALGFGLLVLILAEGGLTTQWDSIKGSIGPALMLSTLGVFVSTAVLGVTLTWLLDMNWEVALVLGAVVTSTDAAAVFSVLRGVALPRRVVGSLEAESGFNDAPVALLVVFLSSNAMTQSDTPLWEIVALALLELSLGAVAGMLIGWLGGLTLRRIASSSSALLSIGAIAVPVLAYGAAVSLHLSGFMAAYVAALVVGNMPIPHRPAVRSFARASGWMAQIALFVMLGLLVEPSALGDAIVPALVVGALLLFVARPLSVVASVTWFRFSWQEQAFLAWAGLRGALPIVLATVPMAVGVPGTEQFFNLVFVLVVILTLVQTSGMGRFARWLGLVEGHAVVDLDVESVPLAALHAAMLQVLVGPTSHLHGVEIRELRLPPGANVTMIVRGENVIVPSETTLMRHGDQLVVVTSAAAERQTLEILRAVSTTGRLAGWRKTPPREG